VRLSRLAVLAVSLAGTLTPPLHAATPAFHPQKGSEILWDKYGIPHLYAKSTPDLFFLYGYAQAEAHGNLLLRIYGESRGRASEYFNNSDPTEAAANLKSDTWVLTNSIPQRSEDWLKQQTPEFRSYLDAFAAGINAYAAKHPEALSAEAKRVLPVTAIDPVEHSQHFVHFTFVASQRLAEPTRGGRGAPQVEGRLETQPDTTLLANLDTPADSDGGSNGWAIAPSHSTSGKSMLLSNPHLAWAGAQTYFECEFNAPDIHIYGATQVGLPVLRFAFNDFMGYTHTVNTINPKTLYRIKTSGDGYIFDGKVLPFKKFTAIIKVRQPDGSFKPQTLEIRETVQGPIIKEEDGDPIALRVAGLDKPFMLEQYWKMSNAHNFTEFETQLKRLQPPMYNVIYADRDGHIEYLDGGDLPRHADLPDVPAEKSLAYWAGIVPGDTSATLWHDYLTYDELPHVIDPPNGYVQNTNEPPWDAAWPNNLDPAKYPPYTAPVSASFRTERSLHMVSNIPDVLGAGPYKPTPISFGQMIVKKYSTRAELADRILPDLLAATEKYGTPQAKQAAAVLSKWDRLNESDSRGAILFYAFARQFMGASMAIQSGFAVPYSLASPMTTPAGLKDPAKAAQQLDAAATETMHDFGALDVPWGQVMRFQINNQSNGVTNNIRTAPIDGVNLPGNGGYGNTGVFRVITFGPLDPATKTRTPIHGDGYVAAIEFSTPIHASMSLSYGNSSQPNSPFHTNQLPLLEDKKMREALLTRKAVEANLSTKETF
jgi:acyl-homoserine-lactone acylase